MDLIPKVSSSLNINALPESLTLNTMLTEAMPIVIPIRLRAVLVLFSRSAVLASKKIEMMRMA
jgi:hypothetical protein